MTAPNGSPPAPTARILRRLGDPFEAEAAESAPPATHPAHVALLNRAFFDSTVDIGGIVRIDATTYICTRAGWRVHAGPA